MSHGSIETTLEEYSITLLPNRWGKYISLDLTIKKDDRGIWRIIKFFDRVENTEWLFEIGTYASELDLLSEVEASALAALNKRSNSGFRTWPRTLGMQTLYNRLMAENVRVILGDKNDRSASIPEEGGRVTILFEPALNSGQSFSPKVIVMSVRIVPTA